MVLTCISVMINDVELLFTCLFTIWISSLAKCRKSGEAYYMRRYVDDVISRIDRMFPEMSIHLSRPNGTSAMLLNLMKSQSPRMSYDPSSCSPEENGLTVCAAYLTGTKELMKIKMRASSVK